MPLYDQIGQGYNTTRRADPDLSRRFYELLAVNAGAVILDVGCGTGNYLNALSSFGLNVRGIDASELMLQEARRKNPFVQVTHGSVEAMPFSDNSFDGVTAVLTMHHWNSIERGAEEICRVLKPNTKLVAFSFTPGQVRGYWLAHYFPQMIEQAANVVPPIDVMQRILINAGFAEVVFENYFVLPDLEDHFMYSCKHAPERCLDPEMRKNTSGFAALANQEEVATGLVRLEGDIRTGEIDSVIKQYANDTGDYLFILARK